MLFSHHQHADLIEIFKILNGYYDINPSQLLCHATLPALEATQGRSKLFTTGQAKLNSVQYVIKCVGGRYN